MVSMAKHVCTIMNVEQLASTRAISAHAKALLIMDIPGHP